MNCRICGHRHGSFHTAREMMAGTGEEFDYFECSRCGCLQVRQYPQDVGRYYGGDYYSFKDVGIGRGCAPAYLLRRKWVDHCLGRSTVIGALLGAFRLAPPVYDLFRKYGITRESRILDVGCGSGRFLKTLRRGGFTNLTGIDPYLEADVGGAAGFRLNKRTIFAVDGLFDCIVFNHSLEHLQRQRDVLLKARGLLADRGLISIAVPVTGHAWRTYGTSWVQLDAPRHCYIHSRESIALLAAQAGLAVAETAYDSDEFQFWGSEQYLKGIPLTADNSYGVNPSRSLFSKERILAFRERARALNESHDGDQAVFVLRRV